MKNRIVPRGWPWQNWGLRMKSKITRILRAMRCSRSYLMEIDAGAEGDYW